MNINSELYSIRLHSNDMWDFNLSDKSNGKISSDDGSHCRYVDIDTNDSNCIWFDNLYSKNDAIWEDAVNNGVTLENIGYTGVDNGIIKYEKDRISEDEFLNLYTKSKLDIEKDDKRLTLKKVDGNNQIYNYKADITEYDNNICMKLDGGFYQGFYNIPDKDYCVLPKVFKYGFDVDIRLNRQDINENKDNTLNKVYPENKGIFFYIGTRAENKWWKEYKVDEKLEKNGNSCMINGYVDNEYINYDSLYKDDDTKSDTECLEGDFINFNTDKDTLENYFSKDVFDFSSVDFSKDEKYVEDEYLKEYKPIDINQKLYTSEGYNISQPNIIEYKTDNKFIFFNQTKDGFTTDNWDENNEIILHDIITQETENYFTLFNATDNGYTIDNIDTLTEENNKHYEILRDLYRNALAFQVKDNGSVGYKYMVKDCASEEENYAIESEFSNPDIVPYGKWCDIHIKIIPLHEISADEHCETYIPDTKKMRIMIYVDGKLRLISKELPMLNIRSLKDLSSKQETVPYNISLGGGTQGLCDVVYLDYLSLPDTILPLEKEFGGTFEGYINRFRIYCNLNFSQINNII